MELWYNLWGSGKELEIFNRQRCWNHKQEYCLWNMKLDEENTPLEWKLEVWSVIQPIDDMHR